MSIKDFLQTSTHEQGDPTEFSPNRNRQVEELSGLIKALVYKDIAKEAVGIFRENPALSSAEIRKREKDKKDRTTAVLIGLPVKTGEGFFQKIGKPKTSSTLSSVLSVIRSFG